MIPFYDSILHKDKKKFLQQIKMSPLCQARVQTLNQATLLDSKKEEAKTTGAAVSNLIAYRPEKDSDSILLNDF